MLSRIANNLFWLGRYIKRVESSSKFAEVEYLASLDAPQTYRKKSALSSILKIGGDGKTYKSWHPSLFDEAVLFHIILDVDNSCSIINSMALVRENAMSARDILPLNVWEAINKMYHQVTTTSSANLKNQGAFEVLDKIMINSQTVQTLFDRAMIRDEAWQFIKIGICLESAAQSCKVIDMKLKDINALDDRLKGGAVENYMWVSLLKSLGSHGMHKSGEGSESLKKCILNTVILDKRFPQSISFNLNTLLELANKIEDNRLKKADMLICSIGKLYGEYEYLNIDELLDMGIEEKLNDTLQKIYGIGLMVEKRYFGA